ncbi:unnamed protein product [Symbiodinium sp. CCMP2456]|nr:unnamed protein product [Symbiodinium sp. CCMP2456]
MAAPGALASTVVPSDLWPSLGDFLQRFPEVHGTFTTSTFPDFGPACPPSFFRRSLAEVGPSVFEVQHGNHGAFECIAMVLDFLSSEPCHRVKRGPGRSFLCAPFSGELASASARAWARIAEAVDMWNSQPPVTAGDMGRTAVKVEKVEAQVRALAVVDPSARCSSLPDLNLAKDVEVSRVSLPRSRPAFDPAPFLDRDLRSLYLSPSLHSVPLEDAPAPPPRVTFRCSSKDARMDLLTALDASGRLRLFRGDLHDHRTACGLFAIPKSTEADRLIVDARPVNLVMASDMTWLGTMGAATALLRFELEDSEQLYLSGDDIRDYYHQFLTTEDRSAHYRFVGFYSPSSLQHLSCFTADLLQAPCVIAALNCMAMGDVNAVSIGQASHIGLVLGAGVVSFEQLVCLRNPPPRQPLGLGVIIDDLIVIEKAARGQDFDPQTCHSPRIVARMHEVYSSARLPRHEKKGFFMESRASFWGADVLGDVGLVRPSWSRLSPLVSLTLAVLELPALTVSLLEVLAGSWVSVLSFRRRALCLLDQVYLLQRGRGRQDLVESTVALRVELFSLCALAPLIRTDLRAKSSGLIVASDASDNLGAYVTCRVAPCLTRELQRHVPTKGLWARLLSPSDSLLKRRGFLPPESELPGQVYRTSPLWTQLAQALSFRLGAVFRRRRADHINLKEMDSYLAVEAALGFRDWESSRSLALLDSQVCLGSLLKGRSASFSINRRLRSALGGLLFFNLHPSCAYVASADNPSDDPTRLVPLRLPAIPEPAWLRLAELGDFSALDSFLKDCNLHPLQVQGFDVLAEKFASRDTAPGFYGESSLTGRDPSPSAAPQNPGADGLPSSEAPGHCSPGFGPTVRSFLQSCSKRQFLWPAGHRPPAQACPTAPGYLCLYSGSRGVAKAAVKAGFPWSLTFDWLHDSRQDLLDPRLQELLLKSLEGHAFSAVGLSPGCPTFSAAVRPPLRSRDHPTGLPDLPTSCLSRVCHDNKHCTFVVRVVKVAVSLGVPVWLENPEGSWLWKQPEVTDLVRSCHGLGFWVFDCCRFGCRWRRRTCILTTTDLQGSKLLCSGCADHLVLRGRVAGTALNWTKVAESLPQRACEVLARALWTAVTRPGASVSSCVRDDADHIGEAKVPGPRKPLQARRGSLFDVELVEQRTISLRARVWGAFVGWLREKVSNEAVLALFSCPPLLALVLRDYADELYKTGASLGSYRQLLAHGQKLLPLLRPHLKPAWEMVSRWEEIQPICHRTPMPEIVLKAMCGLALALGWKRKSAKVQHAKLDDLVCLQLAAWLWQDLPSGSLRAGGAIAAFQKGLSVNDLLWRMQQDGGYLLLLFFFLRLYRAT